MHVSTTGLSKQILIYVLMRPAPLILLAMGIFYLWVYVRRDPDPVALTKPGAPGNAACAHAGMIR
jgi:hypothetical protein